MFQNSAHIKTMLDNLQTGIYILDAKGVYIYANKAHLQQSDVKEEALLGVDVHDLISIGVVDYCISDLAREKGRAVTVVQLVTPGTGAPPYRQLITSTPLFDKDGEIEYFFTEVHNMSLLNMRYYAALLAGEGFQQVQRDANAPRRVPKTIIGESPAMRRLFDAVDRFCNIDIPVLITGESGTGKEVMAEYIHQASNRRDKKLVVVNCAALPENLLEAELFGYEKGSFTGALQTGRQGMIEQAEGGTLFLDEINSLPLGMQAKLLRTLETRTVQKVGSVQPRFVDFRLLSATGQDLEACVQSGQFRLDLYYRINAVPVNIPPLRQRAEDIIPLAVHFLQQFCEQYGRVRFFSKEALQALQRYDWPGNVRQLKNYVERLVIMSAEDELDVRQAPENLLPDEAVPAAFAGPPAPAIDFAGGHFSLKDYLAECEREVLQATLEQFKSTYKAGAFLGMTQSSIAKKKQKYNIQY